MKSSLILLTLMLALTACSRSDNQAKLYEQERNALDKAKAVDATVQKQAQDLQQNLNQQSGNTAGQASQP